MTNTFTKAGITAVMLYGAAFAVRASTVELKHFTAGEFGVWFPLMDKDFLLKLDTFREVLNAPVTISPAIGALGRPNSTREGSLHIPRPLVRAGDVLIPADVSLSRAFDVAKQVGFTGIGLYPDWQPSHGLHLDTRTDKAPGNPATWSALKVSGVQKYYGVEAAFA